MRTILYIPFKDDDTEEGFDLQLMARTWRHNLNKFDNEIIIVQHGGSSQPDIHDQIPENVQDSVIYVLSHGIPDQAQSLIEDELEKKLEIEELFIANNTSFSASNFISIQEISKRMKLDGLTPGTTENPLNIKLYFCDASEQEYRAKKMSIAFRNGLGQGFKKRSQNSISYYSGVSLKLPTKEGVFIAYHMGLNDKNFKLAGTVDKFEHELSSSDEDNDNMQFQLQ
jgi:hypothetical protein